MFEYTRFDASVLLSVAVLFTFALLTTSLIVRMLGSVSPFRLRSDQPAVADGPTDTDLARLDDDGGGSRRAPTLETRHVAVQPQSLSPPVPLPRETLPPSLVEFPFGPVERFHTPMIPGAREPGALTTFGVPPVVFRDSPTTMDAATIAARQREGGGAPSERRLPHEGSPWTRLKQAMRRPEG